MARAVGTPPSVSRITSARPDTMTPSRCSSKGRSVSHARPMSAAVLRGWLKGLEVLRTPAHHDDSVARPATRRVVLLTDGQANAGVKNQGALVAMATTRRARHPTGRRHPDLARTAARLAERLVSEGHPWPDFAATVFAERGRAGLDRRSFAATLGVSEEMPAGVEDGVLGAGAGRAAAGPGQP